MLLGIRAKRNGFVSFRTSERWRDQGEVVRRYKVSWAGLPTPDSQTPELRSPSKHYVLNCIYSTLTVLAVYTVRNGIYPTVGTRYQVGVLGFGEAILYCTVRFLYRSYGHRIMTGIMRVTPFQCTDSESSVTQNPSMSPKNPPKGT